MKKNIIVFVLLLNSINLYSRALTIADEKRGFAERKKIEQEFPIIQKKMQDVKEYIMNLISSNGYLKMNEKSFDNMIHEAFHLLASTRITFKDLAATLTPKNFPKALDYNRSK